MLLSLRTASSVLIVSILLALPAAEAQAESTTGSAENAAVECTATAEDAPVSTSTPAWVYGTVIKPEYAGHRCNGEIGDIGRVQVQRSEDAAGAAANTAVGAPDSIDAAVQGLASVVGQVVAQVESLTGLYWAVSVAGSGPGGLPSASTFAGGTGPSAMTTSGSDTTSRFRWIADAHLYWDPATNGQGAVDGMCIANLYTTSQSIHNGFRFYATSQAASATPVNNARLTKLLASLVPDSEVEPVEASPLSVNRYGSSGSMNLGASLKGEAGNFGAEFTIGRTWSFADGTVGGGLLHSGEHYTQWQSGTKTGSSTAKSAEGVETWKVPTNAQVSLGYSATAWYRQ